MKIQWRIAKSNQGGRAPTRHKVCRDCGEELIKYRFEIAEYDKATSVLKPLYSRVCPQCVLMAYLNSTTFWDHLNRFFKSKCKRDEVVEK